MFLKQKTDRFAFRIRSQITFGYSDWYLDPPALGLIDPSRFAKKTGSAKVFSVFIVVVKTILSYVRYELFLTFPLRPSIVRPS